MHTGGTPNAGRHAGGGPLRAGDLQLVGRRGAASGAEHGEPHLALGLDVELLPGGPLLGGARGRQARWGEEGALTENASDKKPEQKKTPARAAEDGKEMARKM